jgi:ribosomal protein S18 acetylase RimI-like enzyme
VGILSNFLGLGDAQADEKPLAIRPATQAESLPALRLLLGSHGAAAHEQHVQEFLAFAHERNMDLSLLHVAEQGGRISLAALPVPSPGRTMLVFASPLSNRGDHEALARLIDAACLAGAQRDVQLAEALIDPSDPVFRRAYESAGFATMAELIYLATDIRPNAQPPALFNDLYWKTYSPATHGRFAEAILASYQNSLDCPALNGQRAIDDVIEGHKAAGIFDPSRWFILCDKDRTLGILLLSDAGRGAKTMELVYLGLTPSARGRKLGELLMKQTLALCASQGFSKLTLAVDAKNVPAQKLYFRHGMSRLASKLALMRDLRRA